MSKKPQFKKTDIGLIPTEWDVVPLSQIANISVGYSPQRNEYAEKGIPFINISDLKGSSSDDIRYIREDANYRSAHIINKGDILFSPIAPGEAHIWNGGEAVISSNVYHIKPKDVESINPKYLYYILNSKFVKVGGSFGSAIPRISRLQLMKILIPLPPFSEQEKIVSVLDDIHLGIQIISKEIELLKNIKRQTSNILFKSYIEKNKPKWVRLGDIAQCIMGDVRYDRNLNIDKKDGIPILEPRVFKDTIIDENELKYISKDYHESHKRFKVFAGDILVPRHGNTLKAYIVPEHIKEAHVSNFLIVRVSNNEFKPEFLRYIMNSNLLNKEFIKYAGGLTVRTISVGALKKIHIPKIPLEEQEHIVNILKDINEIIKIKTLKKNILKKIKSNVMALLLTGKVRL